MIKRCPNCDRLQIFGKESKIVQCSCGSLLYKNSQQECEHNSFNQKVINLRNCYNRYICLDCGYDRTIDSSD